MIRQADALDEAHVPLAAQCGERDHVLPVPEPLTRDGRPEDFPRLSQEGGFSDRRAVDDDLDCVRRPGHALKGRLDEGLCRGGRVHVVDNDALFSRLARYDLTEEVLAVAVPESGEIDRPLPDLDGEREAQWPGGPCPGGPCLGGPPRAANVPEPPPRGGSLDDPVDASIGRWSLAAGAEELDGVLRPKAAVPSALDEKGDLVAVDEESEEMRVQIRVEPRGDEIGLSDAVPAFASHGELRSRPRREGELEGQPLVGGILDAPAVSSRGAGGPFLALSRPLSAEISQRGRWGRRVEPIPWRRGRSGPVIGAPAVQVHILDPVTPACVGRRVKVPECVGACGGRRRPGKQSRAGDKG